MRKFFGFLLGVLIIFITGSFFSPKAYAAQAAQDLQIDITTSPKHICADTNGYEIIISSENESLSKNKLYGFFVSDSKDYLYSDQQHKKMIFLPNKEIVLIETGIDNPDPAKPKIKHREFRIPMKNMRNNALAQWGYKLWEAQSQYEKFPPRNESHLLASDEYMIFPKDACDTNKGLPILEMLSPVQTGKEADITVYNINPDEVYEIWFVNGQEFLLGTKFPKETVTPDTETIMTEEIGLLEVKRGTGSKARIRAIIEDKNKYGAKRLCLKHGTGKEPCEIEIPIVVSQTTVDPATQELKRSSEFGQSLDDYIQPDEPTPTNSPLPCAQWVNLSGTPVPAASKNDNKCVSVDTAIGEISADPAGFVKRIFSLVLGLAGGIALISIMLSGYKLMAAQGNPEKMSAANQGLVSAIVGLLFIIFSFVILQIIGVDILHIPGFKP